MLHETVPVRSVQVVEAAAGTIDPLIQTDHPVIVRGAVAQWPLVAIGHEGPDETIAYLRSFDSGREVVGYTGAPEIKGRFFYNPDLSGLNFLAERVRLGPYLDRMQAHIGDAEAPSLYLGSTDLDTYLPGLRDANPLPFAPTAFGEKPPLVSIWIGNRTVAATHYDMSNNIACCAVGRRRFTLFPPDQIANLYPGPLEPTPGGQVVSMVDLRAPDLERYPRFADALSHAQVAELEPGDILIYPALWWHNVEALDAFNVMINIWWNASPRFMDTPMNTILHGLLSLRDRPAAEKEAWRAMFDYYLFGSPELPAAHLPESARGALAPLSELSARRLRGQVLNRLNR